MPQQASRSTIEAAPENAAGGSRSTVDEDEIRQFDRLSDDWWRANGPMKALHKLNPLRISYIRDHLTAKFGSGASRTRPLAGLKLLDIGCGGGILAEPLARLGATVTGIDPGAENIAAASRHAQAMGLQIDYRAMTIEALAETGAAFDAVIASEVIEHVTDPPLFVASAAACLAPGGLFFGSTINRTKRAFVMVILGAEYVMRVLPRGTHHWDKFVTPDEFAAHLETSGLSITDRSGMIYNPLTDHWRLGKDLAVNYWISAEKPVD
jgi:2-polyprenyl-6-hydroxyphenyl methylase / 3-demethylubiquinone-9 3-methyltransferase